MINQLKKSMGLVTLCTSVHADVLLDQIGVMDGSSVELPFTANQYFEPGYEVYDIATIDNFIIEMPTTISYVEIVIGGWGGFSDPSSITEYQSNVYSSVNAASQSLIGNVASENIDVADVAINLNWEGNGFLLSITTSLPVEKGMHWISVIPTNAFETSGQTGVAVTLLGDDINSFWVNPGEGFGFGSLQELDTEMAIRIYDGSLPDPCSYSLPTICSSDVEGDGAVSVPDLLTIIAQWGDCGDGTYRPVGDIAPLPSGDCCVDVLDLLQVVADWGDDCIVYGACCYADGVCDEMSTSTDCADVNGYYFGDYSQCSDGTCLSGACCIDSQTCLELTMNACQDINGAYLGEETPCSLIDCSIVMLGDECDEAIIATVGANSFDTTYMTPSQPEPDDETCSESNLDWANSKDVWFSWVASSSEEYTIDTCDINSFDTSLVIYENSCSNQIACNGDASNTEECQGNFSSISLDTQSGTTYYFRIGGWNGDTGSGTLNIYTTPPPPEGACCFPDETCIDSNEPDCVAFGGTFAGEKTYCSDNVCDNPEGDECSDEQEAFVGENLYDTTTMTSSSEPVDESICSDTYLEWGDTNPDVWFHWTATDNGIATFSTCDENSYDTSLVIYTGSCNSLTQIACNGDGDFNSNCQQYYSSIELNVSLGTTYIIRIGGWQGSTGTGTLTISLDGENDTGACCIDGNCIENLSEVDCLSNSGVWSSGELCQDITCNSLSCQEVHSPSDNWYAGTSAIDNQNNMQNQRAELVNLAEISSVKVWGFQYFFTGSQWVDCSSDFDFHVRSYLDNNGLPGKLSKESLDTPATKTATGQLYAGIYELMEWEIPFTDTNVEHLSIQSSSEGLDCWFLWLSSGSGDSSSALLDGGNWTLQDYDLSICPE